MSGETTETTTPPPAQGLGAQTVVPANGATGTEKPADQPDPKALADKAAADKLAADTKAADEAKAAKTADEKKLADAKAADDKLWADHKFKGEGLDEATLKEFTPLARELGLKPEQAQKLVDFQLKADAARTKANITALETERAEWAKSLKADKDIGGAKFDATLRVANKAFEKFVDPETKAFLLGAGLDVHPGLVKVFHKIGLAMADDSISGGTPGNGASKPSAQAQLNALYPSMAKS